MARRRKHHHRRHRRHHRRWLKTAKKKRWIQSAIKHKGSLRKWAERMGFMNKDGTINLREAKAYAKKHHDEHRLRQIILAERLRKYRKS